MAFQTLNCVWTHRAALDLNLCSVELLVTVLCLRWSFSTSWTVVGNVIVESASDTVELMSPWLTQDPWKARVHGLGSQLLYAASELTRCLSLVSCPLCYQTKEMACSQWGLLWFECSVSSSFEHLVPSWFCCFGVWNLRGRRSSLFRRVIKSETLKITVWCCSGLSTLLPDL